MAQRVQPLVNPTGLFNVERPLARQQPGSANAAMTRDLADRSGPDRGFRCGDVQDRSGGVEVGLDGIKGGKGVVTAGDSTGI